MITAINERTVEFRGLSTDEKPINDVISNGSVFFEMDTCKVYVFDQANMMWVEL